MGKMRNLLVPVLATMAFAAGAVTPLPPTGRSSPHQVILFVASDCPKAARAAIQFQTIARTATPEQARFRLAFPNANETPESVRRWCAERKLSLPIASSPETLAKTYKPRVTPEVVVLAPSGRVIYQGRLSNGESADAIRTGELARVIGAIAKGQSPLVRSIPASGCEIVMGTDTHPPETVSSSTTTWHKDIALILHRHCVPCHRSGEVGPMALDTWESARRFAGRIVATTANRTMPPWQADSHGEFHDEKTLPDREIRLLQSWQRAGTPLGDPRSAKLLPQPETIPQWQLGSPDRLFQPASPYTTPAQDTDHYRCFVFPTAEDRDQWIDGIEFQPGNKGVVHHVSAFLDWSGAARKLDNADPGPGYTNPTPGNGPGFPKYQVIGGWTPGHRPRRIPAGAGMPFPKGADLVVEVHYHLTGKAETDLTTCALHFAKGPVHQRFLVGDVGTDRFMLRAGDQRAVVETSDTINADITIHSITPHMHLLGKTMRITAETPAGAHVKLIDIVRWDFTWQPSYRFRKPVQLPRGSRIDVRAVYDNSERNSANPHRPPRDIRWGEGTDSEMCSVFFGYTMDNEIGFQSR